MFYKMQRAPPRSRKMYRYTYFAFAVLFVCITSLAFYGLMSRYNKRMTDIQTELDATNLKYNIAQQSIKQLGERIVTLSSTIVQRDAELAVCAKQR